MPLILVLLVLNLNAYSLPTDQGIDKFCRHSYCHYYYRILYCYKSFAACKDNSKCSDYISGLSDKH